MVSCNSIVEWVMHLECNKTARWSGGVKSDSWRYLIKNKSSELMMTMMLLMMIVMMVVVCRSQPGVCCYTCHQQRALWPYTQCSNSWMNQMCMCVSELKTNACACVCVHVHKCMRGVNSWNQSNTVIPLLSANSPSSPERKRARGGFMLAVSSFPWR